MINCVRLETEIQKNLRKREFIAVVFLDIEKAYDMVWREGLLYTLSAIGIKKNVLVDK